MNEHVKRRRVSTQKVAATNLRNFRSFLLMQQFAADDIGARIAQARKERGLTQEELAEMSSFSKRSLQDYETGVTIPYRHMRELAALLRRPEEWFLYGDEGTSDLAARVEEQLGLLAEESQRISHNVVEILRLLGEEEDAQARGEQQ